MADEMIAFLSLGAKLCPVEQDIDRKLLEKDLEAWYRGMRIKANYPESQDDRTEEEKRFYLKSSWTPQPTLFI